MITDTDIKKMEKVFVTKEDLRKELKNYATKRDLKAMENRIIKSINVAVDYFDDKIVDHESRLRQLESHHIF